MRKPNYGLNKHRKEQDRKAKKDAKLMEKQQRREQAAEQSRDNPSETDQSQTPDAKRPSF